MAKFYIKGVYYSLADIRRLREMGLDPHKDKIDLLLLNPNYHPPVEVTEETTPEIVEQKAETVEVAEELEPVKNEVVEPTPEEVAEFKDLTAERAWLMNDKKARYQELKKKLKK